MRGRTNIGGGGASIEGTKVEATVKSGETILSGSFVEFEKSFNTDTCKYYTNYYSNGFVDSKYYTYASKFKTFKLSDGRFLTIQKDSNNDIIVIISYINSENKVSYFDKTVIFPSSYSRGFYHIIEMEKDKYAIVNCSTKEVGLLTYDVENDLANYSRIGNGIFEDGVVESSTEIFDLCSKLLRLSNTRFMLVLDRGYNSEVYDRTGITVIIYDISLARVILEKRICDRAISPNSSGIDAIEVCKLSNSNDYICKYRNKLPSSSGSSKWVYSRFRIGNNLDSMEVIIDNIACTDYVGDSCCLFPIKDDIFGELLNDKKQFVVRRVTTNGLQNVKPPVSEPYPKLKFPGSSKELTRYSLSFAGKFEIKGEDYFVIMYDALDPIYNNNYYRRQCYLLFKIAYDDEYGLSFGPALITPSFLWSTSTNTPFVVQGWSTFDYLDEDFIMFCYDKHMWRMQLINGELKDNSQGYVVKNKQLNVSGVALTGGRSGEVIQVAIPK